MDWGSIELTDGLWGFLGVTIGILLTTLVGFMKSLLDRRWSRQDQVWSRQGQALERLFEHKQAAHIAMVSALEKIDWTHPSRENLREALEELRPAVTIAMLYGSPEAAVAAKMIPSSLELFSKVLAEHGDKDLKESKEFTTSFRKSCYETVKEYRRAARRDLGVVVGRPERRHRLPPWKRGSRFRPLRPGDPWPQGPFPAVPYWPESLYDD